MQYTQMYVHMYVHSILQNMVLNLSFTPNRPSSSRGIATVKRNWMLLLKVYEVSNPQNLAHVGIFRVFWSVYMSCEALQLYLVYVVVCLHACC